MKANRTDVSCLKAELLAAELRILSSPMERRGLGGIRIPLNPAAVRLRELSLAFAASAKSEKGRAAHALLASVAETLAAATDTALLTALIIQSKP